MLLASVLAFLCWLPASAFPVNYYTAQSVLSKGKWVKIKVAETGVTEITDAELESFGFSSPENVKIFGCGGKVLPTTLAMSIDDDLKQIPVMRKNGKTYFYARAGKDMELTGSTSSRPKFEPMTNPYSKYGYYFLTDIDVKQRNVDLSHNPNIGTIVRNTSLGYLNHELELVNPGSTGQVFLGEDFTGSGKIAVDFKEPALVPNEKILVNTALAYNGSGSAEMSVMLNDQALELLSSAKNLRPNSTMYEYYYYSNSYTYITPTTFSTDLKVDINVAVKQGNAKIIKLDYVTLTCPQYNTLANGENQRRLTFANLTFEDKIEITDTDENTVVWNITDESNPCEYNLETVQNPDTKIFTSTFTPRTPSINNLVFTIFNTGREQNKVILAGEIQNQNLHGVSVPDMLIIAPKAFMPYAEEVAELHRTNDNMEVLTVDQEQIFNEFSSGTPDATAYRRFAKMLFDKNPQKFKYLLLFGTGSFDNRDVNNNRGNDRLLTYQSPSSTVETDSYTTDDYFTYLGDNKGDRIDFTKCDIAVGRMPVATVDEARSSVDKLKDYVNNPDYSEWRNSGLIVADTGDNDLHTFQAEGVNKLISDTLNVDLHMHRIYMDDFPLDSKGVAMEAKGRIKELLKQGMLFATYVGHGGPIQLTKFVKAWEHSDVDNTEYGNIPMLTLATCDVARFDSDTRGIAERMFHKSHGGAIACLASARTVYATENDMLNRAFIRRLFTPKNGEYPTIGDAAMASKNFFNKRSINKLSYFLFGDPAMKLIYPRHGVKLTSVNGKPAEGASVTPMQQTVIEGEITANGVLDEKFNGTVYASVYEGMRFFKNILKEDGVNEQPVYLSNDRIGVYSAPATNGKFTIEAVLPKDCPTLENKVVVNLYAHNTETDEILNGKEAEIVMNPYDAAAAVQDTKAPVVTSMYLDTPDFANGDMVNECPVLFAEMKDETALNLQSGSIGHSCTLVLDGKMNISGVAASVSAGDNGKTAGLEIKIGALTPGKHTLELTVSDAAHNRGSRMITFMYQPEEPEFDIAAAEYPACESATFTVSNKDGNNVTEAQIRVTDNNGKTVWSDTVAGAEITWDLNDSKGVRVAPGAYYYYAQIKSDAGFTSTPTKKIIVVKQ